MAEVAAGPISAAIGTATAAATVAPPETEAQQAQRAFKHVLASARNVPDGASQNPDNPVDNARRLFNAVGQLDLSVLRVVINTHATHHKLYDFLKSTFRGALPSASDGLEKRLCAYEEVMMLLRTERVLPTKEAVGFLLAEVDHLPEHVLAYLVQIVLAPVLDVVADDNIEAEADDSTPFSRSDSGSISGGNSGNSRGNSGITQLLDFLPKLLHVIRHVNEGDVDPEKRCREDLQGMNGRSFNRYIVERLCRARWSLTLAVPLVTVLREMSSEMDSEQVKLIVNKVLEHLGGSTCDITQMASLTAELLLLCSACGAQDLTSEVFDRLVLLIGELDSTGVSLEQRRKVQGAVLTSFNLAISQDVRLGHTFVKQSMAQVKPLSSFRFAMLQAVMRVKRLEKAVSDMICKRLAKAVEEEARRRDPRLEWATPMSDMDGESGALHSDVESANLLRVVEFSANGGTWDLVIPSLVTLGLSLTKSQNQYAPDSSIHTDIVSPTTAATATSENTNRTTDDLGVELLTSCFSTHRVIRRQLCAHISSCVISSCAGSTTFTSSSCPLRFIQLLSKLSTLVPHMLVDEHAQIKDMLTYLPSMPPRVAHALLRAIGPLFALRHDLVDLGMLVLRKAMFQADTNSRLVAVHGLVFFMNWATRTAGSESSATSQVREAALSCIRRAFTQQIAVRRALYGGLGALVENANSDELREDVVRLLQMHLSAFLDDDLLRAQSTRTATATATATASGQPEDVGVAPFNLITCVDSASGRVVEPIDHLLVECVLATPNHPMWKTTMQRLSKVGLSDFGISVRETDPENDQASSSLCKLLIGCCEALFNANVNDVALLDGVWGLRETAKDWLEQQPGVATKVTDLDENDEDEEDDDGDVDDDSNASTQASKLGKKSKAKGKGKGKKRAAGKSKRSSLSRKRSLLSRAPACALLVRPRSVVRVVEAVVGEEWPPNDTSAAPELMEPMLQRLVGILTFPDQHTAPSKIACMGLEREEWCHLAISRAVGGAPPLELDTRTTQVTATKACARVFTLYYVEKETTSQPIPRLSLECIHASLVACSQPRYVGEPRDIRTARLEKCLTECLELAEDETPAQYLVNLCGSAKDPSIALACVNLLRVGCESKGGLKAVRNLVRNHAGRKDPKFVNAVMSMYVDMEQVLADGDVSKITWIGNEIKRVHGCTPVGLGMEGAEEQESRGSKSAVTEFDAKVCPKVTMLYTATLCRVLDECDKAPYGSLLLTRLNAVIYALQPLALASFPGGAESERVIRVLTQFFKCLANILKNVTQGTRALDQTLKLVTGNQLSRAVYALVNHLQNSTKNSNSALGREMKLIPELIFKLEQFDLVVHKLVKAGVIKGQRSMERRAPERDFKIKIVGGTKKMKAKKNKKRKGEDGPRTVNRRRVNAEEDDGDNDDEDEAVVVSD